jgi:2-haloacid dehalogenase
MRLTDFTTLTFDCYGTLIDWESGIAVALQPLLARLGTTPSRDAALAAFARHETRLEATHPAMRYCDLLVLVHDALAHEWGAAPEAAESGRFGASVGDWPAFADTASSLAYLRRHYRLVILSNVDRDSFRASAMRLGVDFDAVFTAEDIGSYNPIRATSPGRSSVWRRWASRNRRSCTPRKVCSTTTRQRTRQVLRRPGSTADTPMPAGAPPRRRPPA